MMEPKYVRKAQAKLAKSLSPLPPSVKKLAKRLREKDR